MNRTLFAIYSHDNKTYDKKVVEEEWIASS